MAHKGLKPPKTLDTYSPAAFAAAGLRALADRLEAGASAHPLVKWTIMLSYWNPEWTNPEFSSPVLCRQVSYTSKPPEDEA